MKRETRTIVGRVTDQVQRVTSPDAQILPGAECPRCGHYGEMGTTHRCTRDGKTKGKGGKR